MKIFGREVSREVATIAEIGVNHEGDVDVASRLVGLAAEAGADAVKFQSYTPARFIASGDDDRFARVTKFGLDEDAHRELAAVAAQHGIAFFSSAISEDWVPLLAELGPAIKIASGDLTFEPVIRAAAQSGRLIILSTGAADVEEIDQAVAWVRDEVGGSNLEDRLVLLHCVSAYPTPVDEANVLSVPFLKERYGLTTGYSNHVIGPEAVLAAVALGARVVEVHVTDKKTGRSFRDHEMSFEPADLAELIKSIDRVMSSLGDYGKKPQPSELGSRDAMRKGIVAAKDLSAGQLLDEASLMFARPATEFSSTDLANVVGHTLLRGVKQGATIARDNVA